VQHHISIAQAPKSRRTSREIHVDVAAHQLRRHYSVVLKRAHARETTTNSSGEYNVVADVKICPQPLSYPQNASIVVPQANLDWRKTAAQ